MDADKNITAPVSIATIDAMTNLIEKKAGILGKAQAARHLTQALLDAFGKQFDRASGGQAQTSHTLLFSVNKSTLETLRWLVLEVWCTNQDLAQMVDDLADLLIMASNDAAEVGA